MKMLYENRSEKDKEFIGRVCKDILSIPLEKKEESNDFAAVFVEGRNRELNTIEDSAAIHSFKVFSKFNYPVFIFCHNNINFMNGDYATYQNIHFIQIPPINSLEEYTEFCIKKLYFMLPDYVEKILTLQPDGMLLRSGWEDYVNNSGCDWLSSHWRHYAQVDWKINENWYVFTKKTAIGNGGFSFRKKSIMIELSKAFGSKLQDLREYGRGDNRFPMEDLFYCGLMNTIVSHDKAVPMAPMYNMPTLKQCDEFSCDPLTPKIYDSPNKPFGFHYFKNLSEPNWPECNHG